MQAETWLGLMIMLIELGVLQSVDDLEYGSWLYSLKVLLYCLYEILLFIFLAVVFIKFDSQYYAL